MKLVVSKNKESTVKELMEELWLEYDCIENEVPVGSSSQDLPIIYRRKARVLRKLLNLIDSQEFQSYYRKHEWIG